MKGKLSVKIPFRSVPFFAAVCGGGLLLTAWGRPHHRDAADRRPGAWHEGDQPGRTVRRGLDVIARDSLTFTFEAIAPIEPSPRARGRQHTPGPCQSLPLGQAAQLSEGRSTWSMTSTSKGPFVDSRRSPSLLRASLISPSRSTGIGLPSGPTEPAGSLDHSR